MALKNLKLLQSSLWVIFLLCYNSTFAQNEVVFLDSIFVKIMDSDLKPVATKTINKKNKPIIIVSTSHCSACVKYFAECQKNYQFIFLMNNESLLEVNRITKLYKLKSKEVYFTTQKSIKSKINLIGSGPTPVAINRCHEEMIFINYSILNQTTQEFTLDHTKVKKALKACSK